MRELLPRDMVRCFRKHGWHTLELGEEHAHDLLKEGDALKVGDAFRRFALEHNVAFPQAHFIMDTTGFRPEDAPLRRKFDLAPADQSDFERAMETMRRWIDLFNALDVRAGVLHVGGIPLIEAGWEPERIFARRAEAIQRVSKMAEGGPTVICLENYGAQSGAGAQTAADLLALIKAAGGKQLGLCLDTGHALLAGVDSAGFIRQAGTALQALHIADNRGQKDDHLLPYGYGQAPWPTIMEALRETGYEGLFNFEVPGESRCPLAIRLAKLDYALNLAHLMIDATQPIT